MHTVNKFDIIASIEANNVVAINQYAPDIELLYQSLHQTFVSHKPEIPFFIYSLAQGFQEIKINHNGQKYIEPSEALPLPQGDPIIHYLKEYYDKDIEGVYIFLDIHQYINPPKRDEIILSNLKTIAAQESPNAYKRLILIGEDLKLPNELIRLIPLIDMPLPSPAKRENAITFKLTELQNQNINLKADQTISTLVETTGGLTIREINSQIDAHYNNCVLVGKEVGYDELSQHFVKYKTQLLKNLKIDVIPPSNLEFGGHEELRDWLNGVEKLLQPEARAYGLPFPKGCLLGGVSGVGKTLIANAIASKWHLPLIKLSIPELKGSLVGESESNLKNALKLISSIKGVLLIDEIEKSISVNHNDSTGVSSGMLSILLDYLNEQQQHFVICTANNVLNIPAELMRKGRLDEIWFANLPNNNERQKILQIHLNKPNRLDSSYENSINDIIPEIADRTDKFSGAELAALVEQSLNKAYLEDRPGKPSTADFISTASSITPLAISQDKQYKEVLKWSKRARHTSKQVKNTTPNVLLHQIGQEEI